MKTKTLLIAAAALAAGIISSQAQTPVYSQNIVGYVNQTLTSGEYVQVGVPLQTTSTNAAEDALPVLQTGDAILLWNAGVQQYQTYTFLSPGSWIQPDGSSTGPAPALPAGTGLFFLASSTETNTFVGTVVLSNTNAPVTFNSGLYSLVASLPPVGFSSLDDTNLNLPLQTGDAVLLWNYPTQQYQTYTFLSTGSWIQPDGSSTGPSPALQVGQGFFYLPSSTETWTQNLIVQ